VALREIYEHVEHKINHKNSRYYGNGIIKDSAFLCSNNNKHNDKFELLYLNNLKHFSEKELEKVVRSIQDNINYLCSYI
jgi:hypothetical protein